MQKYHYLEFQLCLAQPKVLPASVERMICRLLSHQLSCFPPRPLSHVCMLPAYLALNIQSGMRSEQFLFYGVQSSRLIYDIKRRTVISFVKIAFVRSEERRVGKE